MKNRLKKMLLGILILSPLGLYRESKALPHESKKLLEKTIELDSSKGIVIAGLALAAYAGKKLYDYTTNPWVSLGELYEKEAQKEGLGPIELRVRQRLEACKPHLLDFFMYGDYNFSSRKCDLPTININTLYNGETALHTLIRSGNYVGARIMLWLGADKDIQTTQGNSLLCPLLKLGGRDITKSYSYSAAELLMHALPTAKNEDLPAMEQLFDLIMSGCEKSQISHAHKLGIGMLQKFIASARLEARRHQMDPEKYPLTGNLHHWIDAMKATNLQIAFALKCEDILFNNQIFKEPFNPWTNLFVKMVKKILEHDQTLPDVQEESELEYQLNIAKIKDFQHWLEAKRNNEAAQDNAANQ